MYKKPFYAVAILSCGRNRNEHLHICLQEVAGIYHQANTVNFHTKMIKKKKKTENKKKVGNICTTQFSNNRSLRTSRRLVLFIYYQMIHGLI